MDRTHDDAGNVAEPAEERTQTCEIRHRLNRRGGELTP